VLNSRERVGNSNGLCVSVGAVVFLDSGTADMIRVEWGRVVLGGKIQDGSDGSHRERDKFQGTASEAGFCCLVLRHSLGMWSYWKSCLYTDEANFGARPPFQSL
jgi:hypothetical protein